MVTLDGASFRDPSGHVFLQDGRIFRTVTPHGAPHYDAVLKTGLLDKWMEKGLLVKTTKAPQDITPPENAVYCLEHEKLPLISYPYEWSFYQLQAAAVLHLNLQIDALERGLVFSDASAYNIQFVDTRPILIDILSLRPYQDGEFWSGHQQFCEQFLNPLLLRSLFGIPHNAWYRGYLDGIPTAEFSKMLKWKHYLSWNVLTNVKMLSALQQGAHDKGTQDLKHIKQKKLSRNGYKSILINMRDWLQKMHPHGSKKTTWSDYDHDNSYSSEEEKQKHALIADFIKMHKPKTTIDMGCNTGAFSQTAIENGTERIIGFDFDINAIEKAYMRGQEHKLPILPLHMDAVNPSPAQGWNMQERQSLTERVSADALIALAFLHHLVIGKNIPMNSAVKWLVDFAPYGMIEFVPKNDPMVERMLALREDIFPHYTEDTFRTILQKHAKITHEETVSAAGRKLFTYTQL